jgi:deoxyadenosine/deoxycytidine kinase
MEVEKIVELVQNREYRKVVIVGAPATGKSTLGRALADALGYKLFASDDYMELGFERSMYKLLSDVMSHDGPLVAEGVQCYRMLRKGEQLNNFRPDLIIECKTTLEAAQARYEMRGDANKWSKYLAMRKQLDTVWEDYLHIRRKVVPLVEYET